MSRFKSFCSHRHPADVKDVAEAEPREKVHPVVRGLRHERQCDADQTVKAEFLQHAGVQHRGRRRRGTVAQRRPRMERPERNQNAEAEQQQREDEILRAGRERIRFCVLDQFRDVERVRTGLQVKRDEADERDERADAQVKRDLERRVILPFATAPDADHDERRHQREFVQEIKEEQVKRRECAEDAAAHHKQQDVKFLFARLDFPRAERGGEGDNRAHQNQADVQAVHADVVADAERFDPRDLLFKLVAVRAGHELAEHFHRQHRRDECAEDGDGADDDAVIARHDDQCQRRQQRPTCDVSQYGHFYFPKTKYSTTATPSTNRKA